MQSTVRNAIDTIIAASAGAPFADTVDVCKSGDPDQPLRGIVTTFLATQAVIERAIELGANLIITHEPTFYNHPDRTEQYADNAVYSAKRRLLEDNNIVVWRFHDYLHTLRPDPTVLGLVQDLGWEKYVVGDAALQLPSICRIPPLRLDELAGYVKQKLHLDTLRLVGDPQQECSRIGILVGAPGGDWQIDVLARADVDVLLAGEIHEWEVAEYTRDALQQGRRKALVVLGHAPSEETGMRLIVPWLQERLPDTPITFVAAGTPFRWL